MKLFKSALFVSILAVAGHANASLITTDFSNSNGFSTIGNAFVDGGNEVGVLTPDSNSQRGGILFDDNTGGALIDSWTAIFDFTITTTATSGADGFSFGLFTAGNTFNLNSFLGEEGAPFGLSVGFDTYDNGGSDVSGNSVSVNFNGTTIHQVDLTNLLNLENSGTQTATITANNGMISLSIGQLSVFSNIAVNGWSAYAGNFYFAGRTGGARSLQTVDNVSIRTGVASVNEPAVFALLGLLLVPVMRRRK